MVSKEINITKFISDNFNSFNKQLFAIFSNSDKLLIQDKKEKNRIILRWDNIQGIFEGESNIKTTKIKERDFIEEDDITYIVAHQVLKKNGFKIISLSYPGAQGDRAILPQAGTGRGQSRKYIDIVACYPGKYLDLTENKGSYKLPEVVLDIEKLNFYRSDLGFKQALNNLIEKISPENKGLPILLSVSFWVPNEDTNLKGLPIEKINFFITISPDRKNWKIWNVKIMFLEKNNKKKMKNYIQEDTIGKTWIELVKLILKKGNKEEDEKRKRMALQNVVIKSLAQKFPDKIIEKYGKNVNYICNLTFIEDKMYDADVVPSFSPGAKSYSKRIKDGKMIEFVVKRLIEIPESKKAVMVFPTYDDYKAVLKNPKDDYLPCIVAIQFRLREHEDYYKMNTTFFCPFNRCLSESGWKFSSNNNSF